MNLARLLFILYLFSAFFSCNLFDSDKKEFDWQSFDSNLKDSILHMQSSGHIPNSVQGVDAYEPEDFSKVMWIQQKLSIPQAELLLYNFPDGVIKGIAISTLIHKRSPNLFDNFTYALNCDVSVSYYMYRQKLGGYALYEINYSIPENLELYFNETEIKRIRELIEEKNFDCN